MLLRISVLHMGKLRLRDVKLPVQAYPSIKWESQDLSSSCQAPEPTLCPTCYNRGGPREVISQDLLQQITTNLVATNNRYLFSHSCGGQESEIRYHQGPLSPSGVCVGGSFLACSSFWWLLVCGGISPLSASVFTWPFLCVSNFSSFFYKDSSIWT